MQPIINNWKQLVVSPEGAYQYKGVMIIKEEDHYLVVDQTILPFFGMVHVATPHRTALSAMAQIDRAELPRFCWN